MNDMIRKIFIMAGLLFVAAFALGQQGTNQQAGMADLMRSNGKIYVVIAVILTIFGGLLLYLVRLERKITSLEKEETKTATK